MTASQTIPDLSQFTNQFREQFAAIAPLILEEWSTLDAAALQATGGDLEQVIDKIAESTDHTRILVRRQLQELYQIATSKPLASPRSAESLIKGLHTQVLHQFVQDHIPDAQLKKTIDQLEAQTEKLLQQFKREMLPELGEKVQKNPVGSLFTAVGVGFVLGLLLGGRRGR
jgi:hypothetical protein